MCGWSAWDAGDYGLAQRYNVAAGLGMQSIDLAESLDSHTGAGHLRDLYYQLRPYAKAPAVHDFLERARGFVEGR